MRSFSIVEPFQLNWRFVAPRDFETLEYFVTPEVSVVFHRITNGKAPFKIGAYIMQDASKVNQFMSEIMPQRSKERIDSAFKSEEISVFFSLDAAKGLEALFADEGFICRRLEVLYNGQKISVPELPEEDFSKLIRLFAEWKVVSTMDFEKQWEGVEEQVDIIREDIARGMRQQQAKRSVNSMGITKKKLRIQGVAGIGLLAFSGVCAGFSKSLLSKGGWKMKLVGAAVGAIAVVSGIAGKQIMTNFVDYAQKGLIINYG